jgi:hypothetical protein
MRSIPPPCAILSAPQRRCSDSLRSRRSLPEQLPPRLPADQLELLRRPSRQGDGNHIPRRLAPQGSAKLLPLSSPNPFPPSHPPAARGRFAPSPRPEPAGRPRKPAPSCFARAGTFPPSSSVPARRLQPRSLPASLSRSRRHTPAAGVSSIQTTGETAPQMPACTRGVAGNPQGAPRAAASRPPPESKSVRPCGPVSSPVPYLHRSAQASPIAREMELRARPTEGRLAFYGPRACR